MAKTTYTCTPGDLEIFKLAGDNANIFLDYYLRSPNSGTRWIPTDEDPQRAAGYGVLHDAWLKAGKPMPVFPVRDAGGNTIEYLIEWGPDGTDPIFFHHHGWLMLDWQLEMHHAPQPEKTVIGGFGCGKTAGAAMSLLVLAATVPGFKGVVVSEDAIQGQQIFEYIRDNTPNTLYEERFMGEFALRTKPYFSARITNSYVGTSEILFFSVKDGTYDKLRTLEVDLILVEQAERIKDLDSLDRDLGSRLRGHYRGRPRLGHFIWIANAGMNPELWYRFDLGDPDQPFADPDNYYSRKVSYKDNPYLTQRDLDNLERRAGKSEQERRQWLEAERPMGTGIHFSASALESCRDYSAEDTMERAVAEGKPGYICDRQERIGIWRWEMPPDKGRNYLVIADPGTANPPYRDSAVVMVWDITDFPAGPATLRAFHWVFGNSSPWPWINAFQYYVKVYNAQSRCAFDATGQQSGYDHLVLAMEDLMVERINLGGNGKSIALNAAKLMISRGMFRFPRIQHLWSQMLNYDLPDTRLRQDIVMAVCMSAMWMERLFWINQDEVLPEEDANARDRHNRPTRERHTRRGVNYAPEDHPIAIVDLDEGVAVG